MKPLSYLIALAAGLCLAGRVAAVPQDDPQATVKQKLQEKRQAEAADQALQNTINTIKGYDRTYNYTMDSDYTWDSGYPGRPTPALILRNTETDAKSLAAMEEDMNIMARILDKAIHQPADDKRREAMGIWVANASAPNAGRNLEIEGYGAIIQMSVNFPLVGPVEKPVESAGKEPTNSAWDETRQELYGAGGRGGRRGGPPLAGLPKYDPKQVENLKNSILEALKNACNMRNLKPDESVTVVVTSAGRAMSLGRAGSSASAGGAQAGVGRIGGMVGGAAGTTAVPKTMTINADKFVYDARTGSTIVSSGSGSNATVTMYAGHGAIASGPESVLTIRAKKSDIDAFAKGKLNLDEFRNKASVQIY